MFQAGQQKIDRSDDVTVQDWQYELRVASPVGMTTKLINRLRAYFGENGFDTGQVRNVGFNGPTGMLPEVFIGPTRHGHDLGASGRQTAYQMAAKKSARTGDQNPFSSRFVSRIQH